jgi:predicted membrane protein
MLVKKGTFARNTTTGSQVISGLGFQPKAIIFNWTSQTAEGYAAHISMGQGFAAYNGTAISMAANVFKMTDNTATSATDGDGYHASTVAIATIAAGTVGATTTLAEATVTAMGADGFTLNWTKAGAGAEIIHYTILGGTSLTNANVGTTSMFAATGASSVIGVGFQPDAVMLNASNSSMAIGTFAANSRVGLNLGYFVGGASPAAMSVGIGFRGAQSAANQASVFHNTQALTVLRGNAIGANVTYTSMNADGFTLNSSAASATPVSWLALKGGKYKVAEIAQRSGIGSQATTGTGFQPKGVFFASTNSASANGILDTTAPGASIALGSAQSSTAQGTVWSHNTSANPSDANVSNLATKAIRLAQSTATTNAEAGLTSLDANGFTLNWTTADTTLRRIIYFAVGD